MIKIQAAGAGEDGRPFPSRFPEKFLRYLSFLSFSRDPGRAVEGAARGTGNKGSGIWDITDCHTSDIGHWFAMTKSV